MSESHTIEVLEVEDGSGDTYIEIPPVLLKKLNWKEGDDLKFLPQPNGSILVKKVNLETVELDFDDDELFKYMQRAHELGISFNQFCEQALEDIVKKRDFENECG